MTDDLSSSGVDSPSQPGALPSPATVPDPQAAVTARMLQGVRSWGIVSIIFGVVQLLAGGFLSAPWGIVLILVGLASFFFRSPSMYPVYTLVLAWAAVGNILGGEPGWIALGAIQVFWAFRVFQQFREYRKAALSASPDDGSAKGTPPSEKRAESLFPWTGCLLGAVSFVAYFSVLLGVFVYAAAGRDIEVLASDPLIFLLELATSLGILAIAFGLASLVSRYGRRGLAIGAIVAGALVTCADLALLLIPGG